MKLSESSFALCHTFLTSCVLISCTVLWSAYAENTDKANLNVYYNDVNDLSQRLPYLESRNSHLWRVNNKLPIFSSSFVRMANRYLRQTEHLPKWLKSPKRQSNEEMPPPGFVGARGRRLRDWEYAKEKRNPTEDYKTLTEVFPDLWPHLNNEQTETPTDELMAARSASGKKSDSIVYKDGFLGVRG